MKILAVDTATKTCSVAITDNYSLIIELTANHGKTHATVLMGMIQYSLEAAGLSMKEIDGIAVTIGPGSFTGLRIGLSSIKGLSAAVGKPVVGIPTLDALVYPLAFTSKYVCPMIDARKGQVYSAIYKCIDGHCISATSVQSLKPENAIKGISEACIFVGDGSLTYKDMIEGRMGNQAFFAQPSQHIIRASAVAHLSIPRFLNNDTENIKYLVPIYVRKSDAEIQK